MAHLHQKEKWLDHARAMIEGKAYDQDRGAVRRSSTTAFRWRHRFLRAPAVNKPRSLSGIVEADETFVSNPSRADGPDLPRGPRKRGGKAKRRGLSGQYSVLVARDGRARPSTRSCLRSTGLP